MMVVEESWLDRKNPSITRVCPVVRLLAVFSS